MQNFVVLVTLALFTAAPVQASEPKKTPELVEKGKALFNTNCAVCHGEKGDGNGPAGAALNPKPRDFAHGPFKQGSRPAQIFKTLTEGVKDTPMVAWAHLTEDDRWALVYYVLELVPKAKKPTGR